MACFGPKPSLIHLFPRLPRECGWPVLALSCCHFSMLVCNASASFRFLHCLCSHCRPSLDVFYNISGKINTLGLSSLIHLAKIFLQPFTSLSFPPSLHGKKQYGRNMASPLLERGCSLWDLQWRAPHKRKGRTQRGGRWGRATTHVATVPIKGDFMLWHAVRLCTLPLSLPACPPTMRAGHRDCKEMTLFMPVLVAWLSDALGKPQGRLGTGSAIFSWVTWYCTAIPPDPWAEELPQLLAPAQHT